MKGKGHKICHECGGVMVPCTTSKVVKYLGKEIEIKGIDAFRCSECGERVFAPQEVKMIESIMRAFTNIDVPKVDVLNLEETAEYLRVSNQTVYNMIRDGRIKAYKVGREWRFFQGDIISYLNSSANTDSDFSTNTDDPQVAAKGGSIDGEDYAIIREELEKRKEK